MVLLLLRGYLFFHHHHRILQKNSIRPSFERLGEEEVRSRKSKGLEANREIIFWRLDELSFMSLFFQFFLYKLDF